MTSTSRKFDSVHAARLSLIITLSLTVAISTAIYGPLDLKQRGTPWTSQATATPVPSDPAPADGTSTRDPSGDRARDAGAGSVSDSSLASPQVAQSTQAPVLTTTRGS